MTTYRWRWWTRTVCWALQPIGRAPFHPYSCSLRRWHRGGHAAVLLDGTQLGRWPR